MMKSRIRSYSMRACGCIRRFRPDRSRDRGNIVSRRATAVCIRWMLVDSSGSRKPPASPSATQFLFHTRLRRPGVETQCGAVPPVRAPSRLRIRIAAASSSLMNRLRIDVAVADAVLQRNAPLPAGAVRAWSACTGSAAPRDALGTAIARSQGNQC